MEIIAQYSQTVSTNRHWRFFIAFGLLALAALAIHSQMYTYNIGLMIDEHPHYGQIGMFLRGDLSQHPSLTTIPGYHATMAFIGKHLHLSGPNHIRLISLLTVLASVVVMYFCLRKTAPKAALPRSLAFFFLPVMFPYNFLIYTHSLSMLTIIAAVYFYLDKRLWWCAAMFALSLLVRQTNIIWVAAIAMMFVFDTWQQQGQHVTFQLKKWLIKLLPFIALFSAFSAFVVINGGVAIGDANSHPVGMSVGNLYFYMFCFFLVFLPIILRHSKRYVAVLKQSATLKLEIKDREYQVPVSLAWLVAAFFIGYMLLFKVVHPYNLLSGFVHNTIPLYFTSSPLLKATWLLPILATVAGAFVLKLSRPSAYILYPFFVALLLLHPMIEHRYYIPAMGLLLVFLSDQGKKIEWLQLGYFALLSALLVWVKFNLGLFP
ncbi:Dol-P-Glc:Glc(2)Man(9)GlcNAc(2)-PP-Dol alpha-1,2-glucosyltransferase [Motilimonas cestriensis]|uniref:Dol-P-Glc:Glc(2)Man(9)GlcNAc(2)-PP-Dol alpha-1,2-glucosyltransferase n=1 Tax=Motilimonas cestriensis TaxID=2742685 RepID=A0ABS8WA98_9GAMM|nr:Dol-P-Glc:Glc(2)Man(9)GlcNAc(2)-PP-Dol alpha-1,2-glucosyltransferase [Motilimonas cestriensis]MCE2595964.1 Dol-P-Glc:Glc(2)Man(9)GlcNAc(2)-PP-Dol alpha-1,2-glucosyltransferase [Motilimonas cestriensis]